jgi:hypothetical protein
LFDRSAEASDSVPHYFFIVKWPDMKVDDPDGTRLPSDTAALLYANRLIKEMQEGREPDEPEMTMIVKNADGQTIFSIPI